MKCKKCGSTELQKYGFKNGKQRYVCKVCGSQSAPVMDNEPVIEKKIVNGIGMPLEKWKEKYDVDFIVQQTMRKLQKEFMYEKSDVYKLTGLSPSTPGLSAAIDAYTDHYGKAGGKQHFSHPDTINHYKQKGRLS